MNNVIRMVRTRKPRITLATTFRPGEIDAFMTLLGFADRGAHIDIVLRSPDLTSLRRKFNLLRQKSKSLKNEVPSMKALSVRQPWAWAICHGRDVENRPWAPPENVLGKFIAIHASSTIRSQKAETSDLVWLDSTINEQRRKIDIPVAKCMTRGAIVAIVKVRGGALPVDATTTKLNTLLERKVRFVGLYPVIAASDEDAELTVAMSTRSKHAESAMIRWALTDCIELKTPVPCSGHQRIWTLPEHVEAEVRKQIDEMDKEMKLGQQDRREWARP